MSLYLSVDIHFPTVGICMRCKKKMNRHKLKGDPNSPGLLVCKDCSDDLDPYRKAQRQPENITIGRPSLDEALDG